MSNELLVAPVTNGIDVAHRLVVTWQHPVYRSIRPVGMLSCTTDGYRFAYLEAAREVTGFQPFLGFADLDRSYEAATLFPFFAQRIMRPSRPDYPAYLHSLALTDHASAWAILARSQGARAGDTTQVFPEPEVTTARRTRHTFFLNGVRHRLRDDADVEQALTDLQAGDVVALRDEPDNSFNSNAVHVINGDGIALGWVPEVLLSYLRAVRSIAEPTVTVEVANGDDVPAAFRLLVTLSGSVPEGYDFFSGPEWAPATA